MFIRFVYCIIAWCNFYVTIWLFVFIFEPILCPFVISYPFLTHQVCIYHCTLSFLPPLCYSPFQNFKIVRLDNIQSLMGQLYHFLHSKAQESLWERDRKNVKARGSGWQGQVSSEHSRTIALMNSPGIWQHAQDLKSSRQINSQHGKRR